MTFLVCLIAVSFVNAQDTTKEATGKIYFLRSTGIQLYDGSFKTFIDGEIVCKLNNKKYSIHEVPVGKHECSVQFGGKVLKSSARKFEVEVAQGKTTYITVVFENGFFTSNIYCEEITENTALEKMQKMQEDTSCK